MDNKYIITIDGPVGSGKSTVGRLVAQQRGLMYLDTGAMYRAVALEASRRHIDPSDEAALKKLCADIDISFMPASGGQRVLCRGHDVTDVIRTPEISMLASRISAAAAVREALVDMQRRIGRRGGIVVDGRDAGTVVFPQAAFKFYLDAEPETRARRRYKELVEKKVKVSYKDTFADIKKRDNNDSTRALAPLKPADDAVIIDTSSMTIEDVLERISHEIERRTASLP